MATRTTRRRKVRPSTRPGLALRKVPTGIEGFDYGQAGAMLGVKESTVRSLVSQARARFAKGMDDSDE